MFGFSKKEKIYKFVTEHKIGFSTDRMTVLLTAKDPVEAVKKFNCKAGSALVNIVEFIEITPKEGDKIDE